MIGPINELIRTLEEHYTCSNLTEDANIGQVLED